MLKERMTIVALSEQRSEAFLPLIHRVLSFKERFQDA